MATKKELEEKAARRSKELKESGQVPKVSGGTGNKAVRAIEKEINRLGGGQARSVKERAIRNLVAAQAQGQVQGQGQAGAAQGQERGAFEQPSLVSPGLTETLEGAGAFEEVVPKEVSLQPDRFEDVPAANLITKLPLVGEGIASTILAIRNLQGKDKIIEDPSVLLTDAELGIASDDSVRQRALDTIRRKSFNEGISLSEGIGTYIESLPAIGSLARKHAAGMTQTPSNNVQDALGEINKIKEAASTGQEKVRNGLEDPDYGLGRARSMEEDVAKLEGRIQLLINLSSVLRSNNDGVLLIQEQILEAKEKVSRYRKASTFGLTAQLTGTGRIIPSDELLFRELKGGS